MTAANPRTRLLAAFGVTALAVVVATIAASLALYLTALGQAVRRALDEA